MKWNQNDYKLTEIYSRSLLTRDPSIWKCVNCWDSNKMVFKTISQSHQHETFSRSLEVHHIYHEVKTFSTKKRWNSSKRNDLGIGKDATYSIAPPENGNSNIQIEREIAHIEKVYIGPIENRTEATNRHMEHILFSLFVVLIGYYILRNLWKLFSFFKGMSVNEHVAIAAQATNDLDKSSFCKEADISPIQVSNEGTLKLSINESKKRVSFDTITLTPDEKCVDKYCELWDIYDTAAKTSPMMTNNVLFSLVQQEMEDMNEEETTTDIDSPNSFNNSGNFSPVAEGQKVLSIKQTTTTRNNPCLFTPPRKLVPTNSSILIQSVDRAHFSRKHSIKKNLMSNESGIVNNDNDLSIPDILKMRKLFTKDFSGKKSIFHTTQQQQQQQHYTTTNNNMNNYNNDTLIEEESCSFIDKENIPSNNPINQFHIQEQLLSTPIQYTSNPMMMLKLTTGKKWKSVSFANKIN